MTEDEEFVALIHLGPPIEEPAAKPRAPASTYVSFLD
jgi:nitroreductase